MQTYISVVNEVERYRNLTEEEKKKLVSDIMEHPYMDLRSDWAFQYVFKNEDLLKMLLNDFLPEEISSVHIQPNEIGRMRPDDKNIIMDVLCKTADGREFICEMQRKMKRSFKQRMLYYGASKLHSQLKPKQPYSALKPVYVVCFMDYKMSHETDPLVYRYTLCEQESGERYGNFLSIYFCELPRLAAMSLEGLSPVESWFYIFRNMRNFAGKPEEMGDYAAIAEAARMSSLPDMDKIKYFRDMITEEEKLDMGGAYYDSGFEDGMKEGMEKGLEKGMKDGVDRIARNMLANNVPMETILACTGLTEEAVWALQEVR